MRFSILKQVVVASLAAFAHGASDCDDGPFAAMTTAGIQHAAACESKWKSGEIIVGIEAWSAKFHVKAIRFKYSQSGWGPTYGQTPGVEQAHQAKEWAMEDNVGTYNQSRHFIQFHQELH
jgi:hypothetical protein